MAHDSSKVVLGSSESSGKEVTNYPSVGDAVVEAGCAVILESTGKVSKDTSEGALVGISLGKDLAHTNRTAVARKGLRVPLKLKSGFSPAVGARVAIEDDTGLGKAYTGTGDRYVNAVYASAKITGLGEDGANKDVALIDFPGGL
jgi:hypothetical protein